jgi:hypothetical protein
LENVGSQGLRADTDAPASAQILELHRNIGAGRTALNRQFHSDPRKILFPSNVRSLCIEPWVCDRALHKKRTEIERLFRSLKGLRRIFSRFEKLDVLFLGLLNLA